MISGDRVTMALTFWIWTPNFYMIIIYFFYSWRCSKILQRCTIAFLDKSNPPTLTWQSHFNGNIKIEYRENKNSKRSLKRTINNNIVFTAPASIQFILSFLPINGLCETRARLFATFHFATIQPESYMHICLI